MIFLSLCCTRSRSTDKLKKNSYTCLPLSATHCYYMLSYLIATEVITLRNVDTFQAFNMMYIIIWHFWFTAQHQVVKIYSCFRISVNFNNLVLPNNPDGPHSKIKLNTTYKNCFFHNTSSVLINTMYTSYFLLQKWGSI